MNKKTFEEIIENDGVLIYRNEGDSMAPLIRQGKDLVVIKKPEGKLKKYDVPLYRRDNGQYVLHRILKTDKKGYVLCGDNRRFPEYGIEDRHIIGVLKAVIRNGREISVNNKLYRLYVHLWCDFFIIRKLIFALRALWQKLGKV